MNQISERQRTATPPTGSFLREAGRRAVPDTDNPAKGRYQSNGCSLLLIFGAFNCARRCNYAPNLMVLGTGGEVEHPWESSREKKSNGSSNV